MKRVRLFAVLVKSLQSRATDPTAWQKLVVGVTCASVGLAIAVGSDVGAGAQTAIALASLWREERRAHPL
ncbi:hypothetical protein GCM10017557_40900 [Streptomyces aurantiacus]|uniref:Uncharacterized protein n=1 Tax=Streptomyces aurantiacus TaxID=47760 RepID=A0A7G1P3I7_9ACTN|nr:hypothetical protein GCM10017557_40900 [Streptomyces aurantiacus]